MRLDLMPDDLAGKVRELDAYNFESAEAKQRFEQLMEQLKEQLMQQMVDQMSGAMQNMTPEDMARMKDMMAALNEMLEKHQRARIPASRSSWRSSATSSPRIPRPSRSCSSRWRSAWRRCRR